MGGRDETDESERHSPGGERWAPERQVVPPLKAVFLFGGHRDGTAEIKGYYLTMIAFGRDSRHSLEYY